MNRFSGWIAATAFAALFGCTPAGVPTAASKANPYAAIDRDAPPGEGVICAMGLYNAAAEVGRRCFPGEDHAYQGELERAVTRIDEYVKRNSSMTPAEIAEFKREQSLVGAPTAELCEGDAVLVYRGFKSAGNEAIRAFVDHLLSRPGEPSWGDCL